MRYEPRLGLRAKRRLGSSALSVLMQSLENDKLICSKELSNRVVNDSLIIGNILAHERLDALQIARSFDQSLR